MAAEHVVPAISATQLKDLTIGLQKSVADLHQVNLLYGLVRLGLLIALLLAGAWLFWGSQSWGLAVVGLMLMGIAECGLLICTHEAIHGTLLARPKLEILISCLISWPMAWPTLSYGILHRLHHCWNAHDPRDPERVDGHANHWLWHVFGLGGLGMVFSSYRQALLLGDLDGRLSRRMLLDMAGSGLILGSLVLIAFQHGCLGRFLLSWLAVERISGAVLQYRALVEHWGLWQPRASHQLTQLYGSRTISVSPWVNLLMGGLPHHLSLIHI